MAEQVQQSEKRQDEEIEALKKPDQDIEKGPSQAPRDEVRAQDRSRFFGVANAVLAAIHPSTPQLILPENLRRTEADAVRLIYEAKSAEESEVGAGYLSGIERMRYLNQGLMALSHILSLARSPDFPQARIYVEEMRRRLARLRDDIHDTIVSEDLETRKKRDEKELAAEAADEDQKAKKEAAGTAKV